VDIAQSVLPIPVSTNPGRIPIQKNIVFRIVKFLLLNDQVAANAFADEYKLKRMDIHHALSAHEVLVLCELISEGEHALAEMWNALMHIMNGNIDAIPISHDYEETSYDFFPDQATPQTFDLLPEGTTNGLEFVIPPKSTSEPDLTKLDKLLQGECAEFKKQAATEKNEKRKRAKLVAKEKEKLHKQELKDLEAELKTSDHTVETYTLEKHNDQCTTIIKDASEQKQMNRINAFRKSNPFCWLLMCNEDFEDDDENLTMFTALNDLDSGLDINPDIPPKKQPDAQKPKGKEQPGPTRKGKRGAEKDTQNVNKDRDRDYGTTYPELSVTQQKERVTGVMKKFKYMFATIDNVIAWIIKRNPTPQMIGRALFLAGKVRMGKANASLIINVSIIADAHDPQIAAFAASTLVTDAHTVSAIENRFSMSKLTELASHTLKSYEGVKADLHASYMHALKGNIICVFLMFVMLVVSQAVCGSYCGPSWCSGASITERNCVQWGAWGQTPAKDNCADYCCMAHDYCCGAEYDRSICNENLVNCITNATCQFTVCGAAVFVAMYTIQHWCCGEDCPNNTLSDGNIRYLHLMAKANNKTKHAENGNMITEPGVPLEKKDEKKETPEILTMSVMKDAPTTVATKLMEVPMNLLVVPTAAAVRKPPMPLINDMSRMLAVRANTGNIQTGFEVMGGSLGLQRWAADRTLVLAESNSKLTCRETFGVLREINLNGGNTAAAFRLKVLNVASYILPSNTFAWTKTAMIDSLELVGTRLRLDAVSTSSGFYATDILHLQSFGSMRGDMFEYQMYKLFLLMNAFSPNGDTMKVVPLYGTLELMDARIHYKQDAPGFVTVLRNASPVFGEACISAPLPGGIRELPFQPGYPRPTWSIHVSILTIPPSMLSSTIAIPTWVIKMGKGMINLYIALIIYSFIPKPWLINWRILTRDYGTNTDGDVLVTPYSEMVSTQGYLAAHYCILLPLSGQATPRAQNLNQANSQPILRPNTVLGGLMDVTWNPAVLIPYPLLEWLDFAIPVTTQPQTIQGFINMYAAFLGQSRCMASARDKAMLHSWRAAPLGIYAYNGVNDPTLPPTFNVQVADQDCDVSSASVPRLPGDIPISLENIDYIMYAGDHFIWTLIAIGAIAPLKPTKAIAFSWTYHEFALGQFAFRRAMASVQILHDTIGACIDDWNNGLTSRNAAWQQFYASLFNQGSSVSGITVGSLGNIVDTIMNKYLSTNMQSDILGYNLLSYRASTLLFQPQYIGAGVANPTWYRFAVYQDLWMEYLLGETGYLEYSQVPKFANGAIHFAMDNNHDFPLASRATPNTNAVLPTLVGALSYLPTDSYKRTYSALEQHNRRAILFLRREGETVAPLRIRAALNSSLGQAAGKAYPTPMVFMSSARNAILPNVYIAANPNYTDKLDFFPVVDYADSSYVYINASLQLAAGPSFAFITSSIAGQAPVPGSRMLLNNKPGEAISTFTGAKILNPWGNLQQVPAPLKYDETDADFLSSSI
jgi:hypothetical protein